MGYGKLIELLNEYEAKRHKTSVIANIRKGEEDRLSYLEMNWNYSELLCISKGYEFIQRLVDNEKIDLDKRPTRNKYRLQQYKTELGGYGKIDEYSELLMLLSIQDNPIEFLCSVLK